ncbi:hypothetical protein MUK42_34632 [Musa troglodytarum]|uniref:Uncharacterized protein n=1 Tax=Musa troglodytarum TaxID=320322 RepID=A0A9E7KR88_9LILI|nr:hypothetical protein MUK42_34632 [Musa troglodytarum]
MPPPQPNTDFGSTKGHTPSPKDVHENETPGKKNWICMCRPPNSKQKNFHWGNKILGYFPQKTAVTKTLGYQFVKSLDDRVAASGELHLLAKWNVDERVWIAGADAVFLQKSTLTHRFPHPGDTEAREIASATLFSLSVVGEHKVTFGALGATSALV